MTSSPWPRSVILATAACAASFAVAKTPDGLTPSVEIACDDVGGPAQGLCVAFCEAQDCDAQAVLDTSCLRLLDNYRRLTGGDPPCFGSACSVRNPLGLTYDVVIEINTDDEYCLYQDGLLVDCQANWPVTGTYRFAMESGCHALAVEGRDIFGVISAMIAVVRVNGVVVALTGDGSWVHAPSEPPPPDWKDVGFDDSAWPPAVACADPSPWGGAPAPLRAAGAEWVWDEPAGDCFGALGEAFFRLELALP